MDNLPLTVYEILVYVGSGAILLALISLAWAYPWIPANASILEGVLWLIAAYVCGHVIAHLSGYLLEERIVRRCFDPVDAPVLFQTDSLRRWQKFFPTFFRPLPVATRQRLIAAAERHSVTTMGRPLFLHCFALARRDSVALTRMNAFQNQYGFCRNLCLIGMIAAVLFATRQLVTREQLAPGYRGVTGVAIVLSLLIAVVMFYRYLKFYRLYYHEVFTTYAEHT